MKGLVDSTALARIPLDVFRKLGARFTELQLGTEREELLPVGQNLPVEQRDPLRRRRLRARTDDAAVLLRLFCFADAVPTDDVARVLGAVVMGALLGGGVLVRHASKGVTSLLGMTPLDHVFVLDDQGSAGLRTTTATLALCRASLPTEPVDEVLDVGCGAGARALYLARHARRSIGVDLDPRAAVLGRINAALNHLENVEFRVGELFAPVAAEQFDLVVSQPPLIARPEGATDTFGELAVRLLHELPMFLREQGRAVVLMDWPRIDDTPVTTLARTALGRADRSILSLEVRDASPAEVAAAQSAEEHLTFDEAYAARARGLRERFTRLGVRAVTQSLMVIGPGTSTTQVLLSSAHLTQLSGARIEDRLATERLLASDRRAFLRARLRLAPGIQLDRVWGQKGGPPMFAVQHPSAPLVAQTQLNAPTHELLREIERTNDVGTAIAMVAARHKIPKERTLETLLPIAQGALRQGILVPRA